ncbi:Uu.00g146080.m01.CDS01 [Anthostomella pinea]|uniref:Uu.00g146080.m01.CDS01 n=1 Tax=Anthostomella pinea TaxID=933095 RepID=A0AAI8VSC1_9PEZI|nr:Uu.00g146080.m01.CDS01 [Anthostomella pinea]
MPILPPHLLGAIAQSNANSPEEQDAAQRTLDTDNKRSAKRTKMSSSSGTKPSNPSLRRLVDFYDPDTKGPDGAGRTLEQILAWADHRLEIQHDYIQVLFPLPEGSVFNYTAPVIDEETFLYFRQHGGLKANVRRALTRMLAFYGFSIDCEQPAGEKGKVTIEGKEGCTANFVLWVRRMDHNHLRITRIIRSLRVLGLEEEAKAFFEALIWTCDNFGRIGDNLQRIGNSSRDFWQRAAKGSLHIAPDGTEVEWLEKGDTEGDYEMKEG